MSTNNQKQTPFTIRWPAGSFGSLKKSDIREKVAAFCMKQAETGKHYNINFRDSGSENVFYCIQLAYRAYRNCDIDLNTNCGVPGIPGTDTVIFPHDI